MDIQPVWLYLDAKTLLDQFGDERLRWFQPLKTLLDAGVTIGGGSDHMQKIGALRSVNPYHPLLGIQTAATRRAKNLDAPLHPEQSLSRRQALEMYTRGNAYIIFRETELGSLEPGKRADFVVLDTNILECPAEQILQARVIATYLGGKQVWPH